MKNWKAFLKEQNEEVLQEFNKKDEAAVMRDEDHFSVSFEIEMEAEGMDEDENWENMENDMDRARREAAENYFGDAEEYFREDVRGRDMPMEYIITDGTDFFDWYYDYVEPMTLKRLDLIKLAIAHEEEMDNTVEMVNEALRKYLKDPMKFLRVLTNNPHSRNELMELLGWNEKQLTLPFEKEGGKAYHPGYEGVLKDDTLLLKILHHFLGKLDNLQSADVFATSKNPKAYMGIDQFFVLYGMGGSQGWLHIENAANNTIEGIIGDIPQSYGHTTYEDFFDHMVVTLSPSTWEERVLDKYFGYVEAHMEEHVEALVNEYEEDPTEYLDNMGYEDYFDEEDFRMRWYDSDRSHGSCSLEDLEYSLREHFPRFMSKYEDDLKFEEDGSLNCGIEFSMDDPPYMIGLDTAIEFLTDFFEEYNDQSYFSFTQKTGLHTNIGYLTEGGEPVDNYNLFKGLMFINHRYATKGVGFPSREFNRWAGDLKAPAIKNIQSFLERLPESSSHEDVLTKEQFMKKYISRNFNELSDILSDRVLDQARKEGTKSIGFNVNYTPSRNYIEFRYPGETDPNLETMTKALKYYAFVVKASADEDFKKKEYVKDLVGFINKLQGEKVSVSSLKFHRHIKKGDVLMVADYSSCIYKIFDHAMDQSIRIKPAVADPDANPWTIDSVRGREAYELTSRLMTALATPDAQGAEAVEVFRAREIMTMVRNRYPVIYRGLNKEGNVILDVVKYDLGTASRAGIERKTQSAKSFQLDVDGGRYSWNLAPQTAKVMKTLIGIILNNDQPLEVSKALFKAANEHYSNLDWNSSHETVKMPKNYEWVDTSSEPTKASEEARDDAALTDKITDIVMNDYLG